jgi:hypothetical protein
MQKRLLHLKYGEQNKMAEKRRLGSGLGKKAISNDRPMELLSKGKKR